MNCQIDTLSCNLQLTNKALHEPLQRQMMQIYDVGLFRVIDRVFQKFSNHHWEFEEIHLELSPIMFHEFSTKYVEQVEVALITYLENYFKETKRLQKGLSTRPQEKILEKRKKNARNYLDLTEQFRMNNRKNFDPSFFEISREYLETLKEGESKKEHKHSIIFSFSGLLYFLKYGVFPTETFDFTERQVEQYLEELFSTNKQPEWQQQYLNFKHKGSSINASVLENFFSKNPKRIGYAIQLNSWLPLQKTETTSLTRGMRKQQQRQASFAKELSNEFQEHQIKTVVGFIEPYYQETIFQFVDAGIEVVKKQSLTDKITEFKKAIYAFIISYLLLEKGYSFQKKQFVEYQISRLAKYFGIAYERMLQLFIDTLDQDTSFGEGQELYNIVLQLSTRKLHLFPSEKSRIETKDSVKILSPNAWSTLFVHYLKNQSFPKNTSFKNIYELMHQIPLSDINLDRLETFFRSQAVIKQFLYESFQFNLHAKPSKWLAFYTIKKIFSRTEYEAKSAEIVFTVQDLKRSMYEKSFDVQKQQKEPEYTLKESFDETDLAIWIEIFIHYLKYRQFPKWSSVDNHAKLAKVFPVKEITYPKLYILLGNQKEVQRYLKSAKAASEDVMIEDIVLVVSDVLGIHSSVSKKLREAHWTKVWIYFLKQGELPTWTYYSSKKELLHFLEVNYKGDQQSHDFIASQELVINYLSSDANPYKLQITDLLQWISREQTSSNLLQIQEEPSYWVKVFVYYLEQGKLPSWSHFPSIKQLLAAIPVRKKRYQEIRSFLNSKKLVQNYLNSHSSHNTEVLLDDLVFLFLTENDRASISTESITNHWINTFVYFLSHGELPRWTAFKSFEKFVLSIPLLKKNENAIRKFLEQQPPIFLLLKEKNFSSFEVEMDDLILLIESRIKESPKRNSSEFKNHWIKVFAYFIIYNSLPTWTQIDSLDELLNSFPIKHKTSKEMINFLNRYPTIQRIIDSKKEQKKEISIHSVIDFIQGKSTTLIASLHDNSESQKDHFPESLNSSKAWVSLFLYYLKHRRMPWWCYHASIKDLTKTPQLAPKDLKKMLHFFRENKDVMSVWRTINTLSKDIHFREKLIHWLVLSDRQMSMIRDLADIFSPITKNERTLSVQHFGIFIEGATFWKSVWEYRRLLFKRSNKALTDFLNQLLKNYPLHQQHIYSKLFSLIQKTKKDGDWINSISYKQNNDANTNTSKIPISLIQHFLFNPTYIPTRQRLYTFKEAFRQRPQEMMTVLEAICQEYKGSESELQSHYSRWIRQLFATESSKVSSLYREFFQLKKKTSLFTASDYQWTTLLIWKGASVLSSMKVHVYVEFLMLELARRKHLSLERLLEKLTKLISKHKSEFPELYKSLVLLNLKYELVLHDQLSQAPSSEESTTEIDLKVINEKEGIEVLNAGLILLWPFLLMLFKRLVLWNFEEKVFVNEKTKHKAISIVHYLGTESDHCEDERELTIPKILCGLALDFVPQKTEMTLEEKQLCDDLIAAAIEKWSRLGKISCNGFRTTFLQRSGIITREEETLCIRIENKAFDILLDFLPWTINTIRLPWLEKPIKVFWRD